MIQEGDNIYERQLKRVKKCKRRGKKTIVLLRNIVKFRILYDLFHPLRTCIIVSPAMIQMKQKLDLEL